MKVVLTNKKYLTILIINILFTVSVPFIIHGICLACGVTNFGYPLLFAIFGAVNGFLAYIVGDIILISYRHKNDIVVSPIPDEVMLRARYIRYPFVITMIIDILLFVLFCLIFSAMGHWPLM